MSALRSRGRHSTRIGCVAASALRPRRLQQFRRSPSVSLDGLRPCCPSYQMLRITGHSHEHRTSRARRHHLRMAVSEQAVGRSFPK